MLPIGQALLSEVTEVSQSGGFVRGCVGVACEAKEAEPSGLVGAAVVPALRFHAMMSSPSFFGDESVAFPLSGKEEGLVLLPW